MTRRLWSGRVILGTLLAGGVLVACESDLSQLTEAVGPVAFNFSVGPEAAGLPSGSVATTSDTVVLTIANLRALAGGQYQFWVMGPDAANPDAVVQAFGTVWQLFLKPDGTDPVTGDTIYVADSTEVTAGAAVAGYAGTDDEAITEVHVNVDSTADGSDPTTYQAVFVTVEGAAATTPGAARFLWRRIGADGAGSLSFGNFGGADDDYVFGARGAGTGGARGPELSVDFRELGRPPIGFYYAGYVADADGAAVLVDTLRSAWNRDDASVSRVSLFGADTDDALPGVVNAEIRYAQVRNCASGAGVTNCQNGMALPATDTFSGYASFVLKVVPKGNAGSVPGQSVTHKADLPGPVVQ